MQRGSETPAKNMTSDHSVPPLLWLGVTHALLGLSAKRTTNKQATNIIDIPQLVFISPPAT